MKKSSKTLGGAKSLGFTLAEVLITLAIIGVVAALTIPVVVHKYQQKQFYTQFMKVYNTLVTATNLSIAENGFPSTWTFDTLDNTINQYILPNLHVASECTMGTGCGEYSVSNLSGQNLAGTFSSFIDNGHFFFSHSADSTSKKIITLADGSTLVIAIDTYTPYQGTPYVNGISFTFDTNGSKGPNTLGRDIFEIVYNKYDPITSETRWAWRYSYYEKGGEDGGSDELTVSNCDPSSDDEDNGYGCVGRLLADGKMDY